MAKAIGLIGNYTGKLGNTVGYNLKDSNNKQTQGVRVYQPVVKNPRTAGQAEQRAKLAPVNATYRLLKDIIDRGQEGVAYGNKSRLAWLKQTLKSFNAPWFEKGAAIDVPVNSFISQGSLDTIEITFVDSNNFEFDMSSVDENTDISTMGALSSALLSSYPTLQVGDQITLVLVTLESNVMTSNITSFIIDPTDDTQQIFNIVANDGSINFETNKENLAVSFITSREGTNGEHLRSSSFLTLSSSIDDPHSNAAAKAAAIASYMSQGANTDWAEESIM